MKSMTGYGRGEAEEGGYKFVVDIKSVNGKFLDVNIKAPRMILMVEDKLKKQISTYLSRGTVEAYVNVSKLSDSMKNLVVDMPLAKQIMDCEASLSSEFNLPKNMTSKDLLRFNGVLTEEEQEIGLEVLESGLTKAFEGALTSLVAMREKEGVNLKADLKSKIDGIEKCVCQIKTKAPTVVREFHDKIKLRVQELLADVVLDETKLANEVAFFADKADINEEIVRLESHILQFNNLIADNAPVGKKLEFLSQEITREINTTGSKANNIELTNLVLEMKNLNESIKEQIRNVE